MNRTNYNDEIIDASDSQRFRQIRTDWFHRTQQPAVPELYEQTVTTTTTTTVNKEINETTDEMTTTHLERSPLRRVALVSGPQSAYARLFPDKYRQEQEELTRIQRSKSIDNQRYNFDRVYNNAQITSEDDDREVIRKARRVSFYDQQNDDFLSNQNGLNIRTKSCPYLHEQLTDIPLNYDPDPEIVYRNNPDEVVYIQKVGVRYLEPPTPPPPEPIIIREVQAAQPQELPPLIISTTPPSTPRTPSPLIIREQPPTPPLHQPTKIITKTIPHTSTVSRRVIIKRVAPLPAKPRPVIIEKWLPYKSPPERPVIYERSDQSEQISSTARNVIHQYEPPRVRIEQEVQNVGCYRVDPEMYRAQYGSSLRRTDSIRRVLQDIGCNPDVLTSNNHKPCCSANLNNNPLPQDDSQQSRTCFTDQQLAELINSAASPQHQYDLQPTPCDKDEVYYTTLSSNN